MSVLGAMLIDRDAAQYAVEHLQPDDFYRAAHATIFEACRVMVERRIEIDLVTLFNHLKTTHALDEVGGASYIASITDGMMRHANIAHYIQALRDVRLRRDCMTLGDKLVAAAEGGAASGQELLTQAEQWLVDLDRARGGAEMQAQSTTVLTTMQDLERRIQYRGGISGVTSGFADVDEYTSGWQPGDLIIIAARPNVGKTALALNMILAAARAKKHVAMFSLEMSIEQLDYRFLSTMSGVMLFKILKGFVTDNDQQRIGYAASELHELPIYKDDTAIITVPQVRSKARQIQTKYGLDLIVVDYLQLLRGSSGNKNASRQEEVSGISRDLKAVGKDLHVPVIALSQLSRAPEDRKDSTPRLSDLRESGAIEQDADIVMFIHRPDYKVSGIAHLIAEKTRNIPQFSVELAFNRDIVEFTTAKP